MRAKLYRGWYYAVWTDGGVTRRRALRTQDRDAAERALADLTRTEVGSTVSEIVAAYIADLGERGKGTARPKDAWKALALTFAHLRPDQVNRPLCRAYVKKRRREGRKDGTISKELSTLNAALRWQDKRTPAVVELPPRSAPRDRYLTKDEFNRLLAACELPHVKLFCTLAVATGGRATAILELKWTDIDFGRPQIRLGSPVAGRKGRATVPMLPHVREALEAAKIGAVTDYVIEWGGKPVRSVKKAFATACEKAGLDDVTPHVLRHTAAVWMAEAGRPMAEIAQYLGHADDRITQRVYARFSPDYLRSAAEALTW